MHIGQSIAAKAGAWLRRFASRLARTSCLAAIVGAAAACNPCLAGSQYGILWQNTQAGLFGVGQVSEHGTVYGSYFLSAPTNPYADGLFRCGLPPDDGNGCARNFTFHLTELFPGTGGYDFLSYDVAGGAFSLQSTSFSGFVTTPGRILSASCGTPCADTWKPIATGMFNLLGYRALLWYDSRDGLLGEWWTGPTTGARWS